MSTREARADFLRIAAAIMAMDVDADKPRLRQLALERHAAFAYDCPMLFEVLVKDGRDFDIANLTYMLSQIDQVQSGLSTAAVADLRVTSRLGGGSPLTPVFPPTPAAPCTGPASG